MKKTRPAKGKKNAEPSQFRWVIQVFTMAIALSAALSLASESMLEGAGVAIATLILALFILLGILFDIIGVAVTAADPKPFHSMGARDVVGDICGIVSGTTSAVIAARIQGALNLRTVLISVGVTALVSGLTIGGKALGKTFAIKRSTKVVYWAGRFLHIFHRR